MVEQIDSYKKSLMEAFANLTGGYPLIFIVGLIVLPLSVNWIKEDPIVANLAITGAYASINFTRSFVLRRLFLKYGIYEKMTTFLKRLFKNKIRQ
ncbi:hypothetical protein [Nitrosopumilus sp.]|uniref:DUF7220 family protein n=1 Tax=Nitrosopumilus sp. TaxID=2024843 RepID=UPI00247C97C9|nr:hypothetical protein [Nitrosopumilus sp.]MCV0410312.1 hypothetical protein [Nitrosopumilus sp.]